MVDLAGYRYCNYIIELAYMGINKRYAEQNLVKGFYADL